MKVVVTGAKGFIGKNLITHLRELDNLEIQQITREDNVNSIKDKLNKVDIVYHLAGVNRPTNENEFSEVNTDFTNLLLKTIKDSNCKPKFILSSSSQADLDNAYGRSKKGAELVLAEAVEDGVVNACVYRLPGVFGKWCKPNYNSVVATFCYNVANNIPIDVRDPDYTFPLVYVDDVVAELMTHLVSRLESKELVFKTIPTSFSISLGELSEIISSFPESRKNLKAPQEGGTLRKYLYSTYLSHLPKNKFSYPVELKKDDRGDLFEWIKSENFGQIFVSTTKPGITRGNHFHHTKTEKFLVIRGEAVIRFRKIDESDVIDYPVSGKDPQVVDIPVGYTHNITNTGDTELITLFWANEIFDQERTDTYFLEV
jgi:UDP-2-acetamido-2,6-beta-L-arabino-hexul-4-ose reductase